MSNARGWYTLARGSQYLGKGLCCKLYVLSTVERMRVSFFAHKSRLFEFKMTVENILHYAKLLVHAVETGIKNFAKNPMAHPRSSPCWQHTLQAASFGRSVIQLPFKTFFALFLLGTLLACEKWIPHEPQDGFSEENPPISRHTQTSNVSNTVIESPQAEGDFAGPTMGTRYSVKFFTPVDEGAGQSAAFYHESMTREHVGRNIELVLERINHLMSTYRENSEISQFNRLTADKSFNVSPETFEVLTLAESIHDLSDGAFDVTVGPLVELWGFGAEGRRTTPPDPEAINAVLARIGQGALELTRVKGGERAGETAQSPIERYAPYHSVRKTKPVRIDLSAIAKGYAVDLVAEYLHNIGIRRFLVEVGGEISTFGKKPGGTPWRIALEAPQAGARRVQRVLDLVDVAVATSGNYRNFFEYEGKRYGHSLNPNTGWPVSHGLVSVTVLVPATTSVDQDHDGWQSGAATADAWATALMVAGPHKAPELAAKQKLAVIFIFEDEQGRYNELITPPAKAYLGPG